MTPPVLPFCRLWPELRLRRWAWFALVAGLLPHPPAYALDASAWAVRQPFRVESQGLIKLALPASTLDAARPDLADLRVLDAAGREVPYALVTPAAVSPASAQPRQFHAELADTTTVITLETGTSLPLDAVTLATPNRGFIKPVQIEFSADGRVWERVADAVPLFRQNGAEQLTLSLPRRPAEWVRLTVDDRRTPPVPFTGATLLVGETQPAPAETVPVRITARDELPGETVLTLDLGASHLPLTSLGFATDDPLFTRRVTVAVRELRDDTVVERELARGTIYRVALGGLAPAEQLVMPLDLAVPGRELIVHLDNGDSPPLALTAVRGERHPVLLVFNVTSAGVHSLLLGAPSAVAPRYDLPVQAAAYGSLPVASVLLAEPAANPGFQSPEVLTNLVLEGAPFDPQGWSWRKSVVLTAPGVQQLELDLDVLANARRDFADLRLLLAGRQVPYLLEHTTLARPIPLSPAAVDDPNRPRLSRWQLKLPRAGLPLSRLALTSSTALFQRHFRLYENVSDERGTSSEITLAAADWTHAPGRPGASLTLVLESSPRTDSLWLETDNGDNPPLLLSDAKSWSPVVRLLFKAVPAGAPALYYGQAEAAAPRYDLSLVASQLFTAEKRPALLGRAEELGPGNWTTVFFSRGSGLIFWGTLVAVVGLLLIIVVRLLPKPPAA